jgi:hypothetical protein
MVVEPTPIVALNRCTAVGDAAIARATNGAERAFLEQRRDSLRAASPDAPLS